MIYTKIIIGFGIIIGIFLFKKTKPKLLVGILVGLIISFILSFIEKELLKNISFISAGVLSLIYVSYSGMNKRWLNLIIGLFVFLSFFTKLMHYPFANELRLFLIIPITLYILTLSKKEKYANELSILTIFVAYEISEIVKLIEQWIH